MLEILRHAQVMTPSSLVKQFSKSHGRRFQWVFKAPFSKVQNPDSEEEGTETELKCIEMPQNAPKHFWERFSKISSLSSFFRRKRIMGSTATCGAPFYGERVWGQLATVSVDGRGVIRSSRVCDSLCKLTYLKADAWQPGAGRREAILALCSPLLGPISALCWPYVSPMLAVCCPRSAPC